MAHHAAATLASLQAGFYYKTELPEHEAKPKRHHRPLSPLGRQHHAVDWRSVIVVHCWRTDVRPMIRRDHFLDC